MKRIKQIFIGEPICREPSKYKVLWSDKWNNSWNVVFIKRRWRRPWDTHVDRYINISAPGCQIWSTFHIQQSTGRATAFHHPPLQHRHLNISSEYFSCLITLSLFDFACSGSIFTFLWELMLFFQNRMFVVSTVFVI